MIHPSHYVNIFNSNYAKLENEFHTHECDCQSQASGPNFAEINNRCLKMSRYLQDLSTFMLFAPNHKLPSNWSTDEKNRIESLFNSFENNSAEIVQIIHTLNKMIDSKFSHRIADFFELIHLISLIIHLEYMIICRKVSASKIANYGFENQAILFLQKPPMSFILLNDCINCMTSEAFMKCIKNLADYCSQDFKGDFFSQVPHLVSANFMAFCLIFLTENAIFRKIFKSSQKNCLNFLSLCGTISACEMNEFKKITSQVLKSKNSFDLSKVQGLVTDEKLELFHQILAQLATNEKSSITPKDSQIDKILHFSDIINITCIRRCHEYNISSDPDYKSNCLNSLNTCIRSNLDTYIKVPNIVKLSIKSKGSIVLTKMERLLDSLNKSKKNMKYLKDFLDKFDGILSGSPYLSFSNKRINWILSELYMINSGDINTKYEDEINSIVAYLVQMKSLTLFLESYRNLLILTIMVSFNEEGALIESMINYYLSNTNDYSKLQTIVSFLQIHEVCRSMSLYEYFNNVLIKETEIRCEYICANLAEFIYHQSKSMSSICELEYLNEKNLLIVRPLFDNINLELHDLTVNFPESQIILHKSIETSIVKLFIDDIYKLLQIVENDILYHMPIVTHFIGMLQRSHSNLKCKLKGLIDFEMILAMVDKDSFYENLLTSFYSVINSWTFDFQTSTFYTTSLYQSHGRKIDYSSVNLWGNKSLSNSINCAIVCKYYNSGSLKLSFHHLKGIILLNRQSYLIYICSGIQNYAIGCFEKLLAEFFDKLYENNSFEQYSPYKIDQNFNDYREYIIQQIKMSKLDKNLYNSAIQGFLALGNSIFLLHIIDLCINCEKNSDVQEKRVLIEGFDFKDFVAVTQGILETQSNPLFESLGTFSEEDKKKFFNVVSISTRISNITDNQKIVLDNYQKYYKEYFSTESSFVRGLIVKAIESLYSKNFENKNVDSQGKYFEALRIEDVIENYLSVGINMIVTEFVFSSLEMSKRLEWSSILAMVLYLFISDQYDIYACSSPIMSLFNIANTKDVKQISSITVAERFTLLHRFLKESWRDDDTCIVSSLEHVMPKIKSKDLDEYYLLEK